MRKHIIVSGMVQGVGFRFSTKQTADELGLFGWVQNNADGTVEMEVEGSEDQLNVFVDKLKAGFTPVIQVESTDITTYDENKNYQDFTIKH
ncbi:Acylphosphatase [Lentibacillus sp. JNUCC-1]|uniref:acylphosphatase n=1 Tax=Lentibacillus sp. JNUCC-1 TaxID=2654513 RepID=UPI0012E8832F|nr:acylphosphatase [Lentibacillus sp. JNUCC-1]MUV39834.1 Acylphosphatase [Lentibacillus sp. JNUCC-1]